MSDTHKEPFDLGTDELASGDAMAHALEAEQGLAHVVDEEHAWRRSHGVHQPTHGEVHDLGTDELASGDAMTHALADEQKLQRVVDDEREWRHTHRR